MPSNAVIESSTSPKKGARKRVGVPTRAKTPSRSKLVKLADKLTSLFVRAKYRDSDGLVSCYTCTYRGAIIHCGHYISRTYKYTRWDLDNLRPQCFMCNVIKKGCAHLFRENLVNEIGEERVKAIEAKAKLIFKEKDDFILAIIAKYETTPH